MKGRPLLGVLLMVAGLLIGGYRAWSDVRERRQGLRWALAREMAYNPDRVWEWCPSLYQRSTLGPLPNELFPAVKDLHVPRAVWWDWFRRHESFAGTATVEASNLLGNGACVIRVGFAATHRYRDATVIAHSARHGASSISHESRHDYRIDEWHLARQ